MPSGGAAAAGLPPGWDSEDHAAALAAFFMGRDVPPGSARAWFEAHFRPADPIPAFYTGYYEPELDAALTPGARFSVPLHAPPPGHAAGDLLPKRAVLLSGGLLNGCDLAWVESPLEAFLAQVQGSVRLRLAGGGVLRLGFAGRNGHPYRSIGAELIRRGAIAEPDMSADAIRAWCAAHPSEVPALLATNPSYVFFRPLDLPPELGPPGVLGLPLTPLRSLAVDPAHVPLGTPVWVEIGGTHAMRRLMIAQDTGSAIRGAGRGDVFFGSGAAAGARAGALRAPGRMIPLVPR